MPNDVQGLGFEPQPLGKVKIKFMVDGKDRVKVGAEYSLKWDLKSEIP